VVRLIADGGRGRGIPRLPVQHAERVGPCAQHDWRGVVCHAVCHSGELLLDLMAAISSRLPISITIYSIPGTILTQQSRETPLDLLVRDVDKSDSWHLTTTPS
jgi:hypothetical protein